MRKLFITILAFTLLVSCKEDFLDEVNYSLTSEVFETEQGLEGLMAQCYKNLRFFYGGDNIMGTWSMAGTDLFQRGRASQLNIWHQYNMQPTSGEVSNIWNKLYQSLNEVNTFLYYVDQGVYADEGTTNTRKGEALFNRAIMLWLITEHFGDVHLQTEPSVGATFEAFRSPKSDFYAQIVADLQQAIPLLPENESEVGRFNSVAAQGFLARMYLYNQDYENAASMANTVITNGKYTLEDNYADMWNTKSNSETNSEFMAVAVFTEDPNNGPIYFQFGLSSCRLNQVGHTAGIVNPGGNGRNRLASTRYFVTVFDNAIDSRVNVVFGGDPLEIVYSDDESLVASVWFPREATADELAYYEGLQATQAGTGYELARIFQPDDIYAEDNALINISLFYETHKMFNEDRIELDLGNHGVFNHPIVRIAEMYLIKAEAEMFLGRMGDAVNTMNILRRARARDGMEDAMEITEADLDVDFILDERARELAFENMRKFDLIRLGKYEERVTMYSADALPSFNADTHKVLPIPQSQLDAMTPESAAAFGQNDGY